MKKEADGWLVYYAPAVVEGVWKIREEDSRTGATVFHQYDSESVARDAFTAFALSTLNLRPFKH